MDFLTKEDISIIQTIEHYPVIYDKSHTNYKNTEIKQNAMKEISIIFNLPGNFYKYEIILLLFIHIL